MIEVANSAHLNELLAKAETPVVTLFGASWCGPCKTFKPVLQELCDRLQVPLFYVQIDEQRQLAGAYAIRAVPTIVAFSGSRELGRMTGSQTTAALSNFFLKNGIGQIPLDLK